MADNATAQNLPAVVDSNYDDGRDHHSFDDIDHPRQRKFLQALARVGAPTAAERLTGINRDNHYWWLDKDPDELRRKRYSAAVKRAIKLAGDSWEDEVAQRAFIGYQKPIVYKGEITGYTVEKSDILAMFRLNGERPEKYHSNSAPIANSAPVTINITNYSDHRTINVESKPASEPISQRSEQVKVGKW